MKAADLKTCWLFHDCGFEKSTIDTRFVDIPFSLEPYVSAEPQEWCRWPYRANRKGCPNFGEKPGCPPRGIIERFDTSYILLVHQFDLGAHAARMREKHPQWSDRQCRCLLYWQPRARKQFRKWVERTTSPAHIIIWNPEAHGVNLFRLCAALDVPLQWPPIDTVTLLALKTVWRLKL